jgi:hypothetical protein
VALIIVVLFFLLTYGLLFLFFFYSLGDNYESETLFVVVGYQFISSAMTYNFGYEWRGSWFSNTKFTCLVAILTALHFYVTMVPGSLSCLFRMNCDNDHVLPSISHWDVFPIQNDFNTTLMPFGYRVGLVIIVLCNTISVMCWDYFLVNGLRKRYAYKKRTESAKFVTAGDDEESGAVS